ncbi:MAG: hypothetical protein VX777_04550 [Chlamydiota bacterium]|nr:hypothetical protein [Chlamydiota bacterium]
MFNKIIATVFMTLSASCLSAAFMTDEQFDEEVRDGGAAADRIEERREALREDGEFYDNSPGDELEYRRETRMPDPNADSDYLLEDHPLQERPLQEDPIR